MTPVQLELDGLSRNFDGHLAVAELSLSIARGELIVLLGPSGCGKTTTLRMIAGFVAPGAGDIRLDGRSILDLPAHRRELGIVFQSYALFPHLTVARNVAFGLEMRNMKRAAVTPRVDEMLRLVKLDHLAHRLPRHLSGGQQQRVALARALAIHPKVLLLDEPLSNLDAALRGEMAREIKLLQRDRGITTVMVTHDQTEAMALADRLVVMRDGRVQQIGRQEDLYQRPANPFVARFIGASNLIPGRLDHDRLILLGDAHLRLAARYRYAGEAVLAVRPESIRLQPARDDGRAQATVELCTYLGAIIEHAVRLAPEITVLVRGPGLGADATPRYDPGTRVGLTWEATDERVFDANDRPLNAAAVAPQGETEWTN